MALADHRMPPDEMKKRILELGDKCRRLESAAATRESELKEISAYAESYLDGAPERPAFSAAVAQASHQSMLNFSESPCEIESAIEALRLNVDGFGTDNQSPDFLAFVPGGALYEAVLGDFIAGITNRYAGVGFAAPGASNLEQAVIRWLAELIGYPASAEGDLTSGGSIAALSAVVTAREARGIAGQAIARSVVYMTSHTHHCILKALKIAGLSQCIVREVRCDAHYRMDAENLAQSLRKDNAAGLNPWLVVATAGTTDTGAIDPIPAIADIAEHHELWLHVDAAYGGAFMLCDEGRRRLRGIERSDSLMLDPHKGFFIPFGSGVVLIREGTRLYHAYKARGTYMRDLDRDDLAGSRSACDYSPELTRPFRGLRLWLPLKIHGLATFRAALEEKLLLARYCHQRLSEINGFEVGPPPELSILVFRYVPQSGDANTFNQKFFEVLRDSGGIFLSTTVLDGKLMLRLAVLAVASHIDTIDSAVAILEKTATVLQESCSRVSQD